MHIIPWTENYFSNVFGNFINEQGIICRNSGDIQLIILG